MDFFLVISPKTTLRCVEAFSQIIFNVDWKTFLAKHTNKKKNQTFYEVMVHEVDSWIRFVWRSLQDISDAKIHRTFWLTLVLKNEKQPNVNEILFS